MNDYFFVICYKFIDQSTLHLLPAYVFVLRLRCTEGMRLWPISLSSPAGIHTTEGESSMSRSTLPAIILTILCFAAALLGLSYACVFTEVNGLSVISHGIHVFPQNETALIEKLEQYAAEDYRYFVATDGVNIADCKREGVVLTMRYTTPQPLIWTDIAAGTRKQVFAERITVTIPDTPDNGRELSYYVIVDKPGEQPGMLTFQMPREQADELLKLAGFSRRVS